MGKAADWLREERRKTLGDWVAFCVGCGYTRRYFAEFADEVPRECPQCGGEVRSRCPGCGARFASAVTVDCEECGAEVRPGEIFGFRIRKR
jgi:predicted nucleic acid-binding Zn ribbon protein